MPKFQEDAVILEQQEVAERTHRLRLRCHRIAAAARAGQFLMLQVRSGSEPLLKRPFSFHRILPREGCIEILYRVTGQGTWWLSQGLPGTRLNAVGPLGNGFDLPDRGQRVVALVAGGIGIAPFDQLMTDLMAVSPSGSHDVHLFYGARTAVEMVPVHPYERLGVTVHLSTDDGSRGARRCHPALRAATAAAAAPRACFMLRPSHHAGTAGSMGLGLHSRPAFPRSPYGVRHWCLPRLCPAHASPG